ncbi:hypothetical protein COU95_00945 [Candidatus Shapirobacteria bacterium CG10_big_fil_rev_8_21_14_0_10_40_9]|uniref:Uncharacterized protein n=1 Tax=Candidatus Shapirobacteria bacterium CG10_big_fil_rev_8_21_14_0_10_40_9 TaxID=1974888 RepID=A0A2M8L442_9BACT|nr:MAG: hypothetical protein COU95_00945 [Candidatus Shapirobacteria bacterium CG10_big_fil_rev_8_21_14_0_10_40_9]
MGVLEIQESNLIDNTSVKTIDGVAPSVWGWGGMKLGVKVYQTNNITSIELNGFIAQLGVSPLTGKMDDFLKRLHDKLATQYNYDFQYEKLTRFLPKYKLHFSKIDLTVLSLILVITFISTFANVFGGISKAILIGPVLGIGYYLGRKYLFSNKTIEKKE